MSAVKKNLKNVEVAQYYFRLKRTSLKLFSEIFAKNISRLSSF